MKLEEIEMLVVWTRELVVTKCTEYRVVRTVDGCGE